MRDFGLSTFHFRPLRRKALRWPLEVLLFDFIGLALAVVAVIPAPNPLFEPKALVDPNAGVEPKALVGDPNVGPGDGEPKEDCPGKKEEEGGAA